MEIFKYEELPEEVKQRIANDIVEAQIEPQFECLKESFEEIFGRFEWISDFKSFSAVSYSQSDYIGVGFEFRRTGIKSNTVKNILKDLPDLKDVVLAYKELIKNLKIGEWFIVKFEHYGISFNIDFRDIEGDSHDFSRTYNLNVNDAGLKESAIINFVKEVRAYVKKHSYSLLNYIYSDEFIKDEVADCLYDSSGKEVENDKI